MRTIILTNAYMSKIEKMLTDDDYVRLMTVLAAKAVQRLCEHVPSKSAFHIIASVEDFELLALPVVEELGSHGHDAVWSCVWPDQKTIGAERRTTIAPIVVSVDEAPFDKRKHLILVSSCIDTTAVMQSMLTHAHSSPDLAYERISVIAPFFGAGMRQRFKQALPRHNAEKFGWFGLFQVPSDSAVRLKERFTRETASALGVDFPEALRRHMPTKILRRFDDTPKAAPGLSK